MTHNRDLWDSLDDCLFDVFDEHCHSTIERWNFKSVLKFKLSITKPDIYTYNKVLERLELFMKINKVKKLETFTFTGSISINDTVTSIDYVIKIKI